ncbi:G-protein coupled receptor 83-like [Oppia nitens]|uniref:G-protein coupled receptor 83-like n=1 Tax=Oppia nitens TaxID=1686743 RepID=UPI0023DBA726|nr:G-protein coupled receptor 83-like [Oppia nitens]
MTVIAIDRYQAIINPLHRRLSTSVPIIVIIAIIWLTALIFSIPNVAFNEVVVMKVHRELYRCRAVFPNHRTFYRQVITMFTFLTQYVVPLSITAFAYIIISFNIWFKLLSTDTDQQKTRERSRRRTIKMLAIVVLVFAICWLPLNIHHIYSDFINTNVTDINWFLVCHWFAMSSVCYNPWIYFCLNKHFRQEIKNIVRCTGMWCWNGSFIEVSSSSSSQRANKPNLQRTNALRLITTNGVLKQSDAMVINDNNSMIVNNNKVSQLMIEESII